MKIYVDIGGHLEPKYLNLGVLISRANKGSNFFLSEHIPDRMIYGKEVSA